MRLLADLGTRRRTHARSDRVDGAIGDWNRMKRFLSAACVEQRISSGLRAQDNNLSVRPLRACCSDPTNIPESASLRS